MPETTAHPSREQLSAYNLGQLPPDEAVAVESHISECEPCCDTIMNLSSDDTFVGLLKEARQLPTDQTLDHNDGLANPSSTSPDIPESLGEHPRYEIVGLIGKGGMGDVYKARHRMMDRTVALKIINRELMRKREAVDRFHREVTTAAKLSHPNIVTAHDAEQAGDVHFMVMEYVDGVNLSEIVNERGALLINEACEHIRQAATGMQYAHEKGMVHRDIKPHNLMVTGDGTVKILDFGLASLAPEAKAEAGTVEARGHLTAVGAIMGTPDFISPEQADDARKADVRSDIYSLGATLYFLLAGRPPFAEGSVTQKLQSHAQADPEPLESLRDDVPPELVAVVTKMTAKDPEERYLTPSEVADALESFLRTWRPDDADSLGQVRSHGGHGSGSDGQKPGTGDAGPDWLPVAAQWFFYLMWIPIALLMWEVFFTDQTSDAADIRFYFYIGAAFCLSTIAGALTAAQRLKSDAERGDRRIFRMSAGEAMLVAGILIFAATYAYKFHFSASDGYSMVSAGAGSSGDGWYVSAGSTYLKQEEPGVLFGMCENPEGDRSFSYIVLFRHEVNELTEVSSASNTGLQFDGETASIRDGLSIDGKGIELDLEMQMDRQEIQSSELVINGTVTDASRDRLFLVDLTSDGVTWNQVNAKFPHALLAPKDVVGDTYLVAKVARRITEQLANENDQVRKFLAGATVETSDHALTSEENNAVTAADPRERERELLQGDWDVIAFTQDGRKEFAADKGVGMLVRIEGETITRIQTAPNGEKSEKEWGRIEIDSTTNPKSIDIVNPDDPGGRLLGIYELKDGALKICFAERRDIDVAQGRPVKRPTKFSAPAGSDIVLLECRRAIKDPDLEQLQGEWELLKVQEGDRRKSVPPDNALVTVQGNRLLSHNGSLQIEIDGNQDPKTIDFYDQKGVLRLRGIYKFSDDRLIMILHEDGKLEAENPAYPKSFDPPADNDTILWELRKAPRNGESATTRTILDQRYKIIDGGKEIGSRHLVVTKNDQTLSIVEENSLELKFDGVPPGVVESDGSAVYSLAGDTPRIMRATISAKEQGAMVMHGTVEFNSKEALARWTSFTDGGRKLQTPKKQQATHKPPPPGPLVMVSTIQVVGPLLLPEDGERKVVWASFNNRVRSGRPLVEYEAGWRLRRTSRPEGAGFTITVFEPDSDEPEMTWEYDSKGNCERVQLTRTTVMKPHEAAAEGGNAAAAHIDTGGRLKLSPDLAKAFAQSGQSLAEFKKNLHTTISQAAGIPNDQWEEFATDPRASTASIEGDPLSLVLLWLNPPKVSKENPEALKDFRLLTSGFPKPTELHEAMAPSQPHGYVSVIQPEYIKDTNVDIESGRLRGSVEFEAPDLYAGRVDFAMEFKHGRMQIIEFKLPNYDIAIAIDDQGEWVRKAAADPDAEADEEIRNPIGNVDSDDAAAVDQKHVPDIDAERKTTAFLVESAKRGDRAAVEAALKAGVDPNGPDGQLTALHWTVAQRLVDGKTIDPSPEIARQLIDAGADVNAKDYLDQSPLEWAAKYASPEIVKMLIKAGADVNAESRYGTVLLAATVKRQAQGVEIAKLLIEAGADVNAGKYTSALANAAKYGNAELIQLLVEEGAKVNDPKDPPIHWAGKPEAAEALIEAGADVNLRNAKGETALHLNKSTWSPNAETVELLIDAGADVKAKSATGSTPLHAAVQQGKPEIAKLLIAAGADVDASDKQGNTPLSIAQWALSSARGVNSVDNTPYETSVQLLVDAGAKDDGRTELQQAVAAGDLEQVKKLIAAKADVNATGPQGITAVHLASEKGHVGILAALIKAGAKVDAVDAQLLQPLHLAANAETARLLIAKGAKVNTGTPSPLYMATMNGKADVVRELLRNDANAKDSDCATMLNWATFAGQIEVVKELFELRDAKTLLAVKSTYSPLHVAASGSFGDMGSSASAQQRLDIAKLLVANGAEVNARWGENVNPLSGAAHMIGTTPLMFASQRGETEMVKFLLDQQADVQAKNASGQTVLHFAAQYGHRDVVELLLKAKADVNALTREAKTPLDLTQDAAVKVVLIQKGGKTASEVLKDSQR